MISSTLKLLTITLLSSLVLQVNGQGCSDAGFCTLNSFKPNSQDSIAEGKNQLNIGVSYGSADHSIAVFGTYLEYNRQMNDKLRLDAKITTLSQNGNNIAVFGFSDIYVNATYQVSVKGRFTIGTKIPLTDGNRSKDNLSLPMDYQSSLGTVDVIVGMGYMIRNFQLAAALQQPITQNNNGFIAENYPGESPLRTFQSTNNFERKGDVLLRVSYPIKLGEKIRITPSILPIYHLGNDRYTDLSGAEYSIPGSQGLTLNGNAYLDYEINKSNALQLSIGLPFIVRETRPDGLTRSFVISFEYRIKF